MNEEDLELLQEFIEECREHLEQIEPDLLEIEQAGSDVPAETVNRVFRAVHSTKGGAAFLDLNALKDVSHSLENVLAAIRAGELEARPDVVDVLLQGVDALRTMVEDIDNSEQVPHDDLLRKLDALLAGEDEAPSAQPAAGPTAPDATASDPLEPVAAQAKAPTPALLSLSLEQLCQTFRIGPAAVGEVLASGMQLHQVTLLRTAEPRLSAVALVGQIGTVGNVLGTSHDVAAFDAAGGPPSCQLLCATPLAAEMMAPAVGAPPESCVTLDPALLRDGLTASAAPAEQGQASDPASGGAQADKPADKAAKETLRVRLDLLTKLMNTAGELVLGRNQLLRALEGLSEDVPGLTGVVQHLDRVTTELQEGIMQTRMQPVGVLFGRFGRVIRDLARKLGKEVDVVIEGSEVELDKSIIEMLADPLTHIVRNCVDHGIEAASERSRTGKGGRGRIAIRAFHQGGQVNISVTDDGRGMSPDRILSKAIERGIVDRATAERMSERDVINLVTTPGFSTTDQVSELSGRGVGMDVVRTNIEKLGGDVELQTRHGHGTTVLLRLPLTLAIIPSLVVGVGEFRFAVPQVSIVELVMLRGDEAKTRLEKIHDARVLRLRGRLLPIVRLGEILDIGDGEREHAWDDRDHFILVLRAGQYQFGAVVDEVFESEEIVVKPLSSYIKEIKCFAGTTILGDGKVIMILDTGGLAELAQLSFLDLKEEERRRRAASERLAAHDNAERHSVILLSNVDGEVFALPQDRVLRLERVTPEQIRQLGGQPYIQYRGNGLPVIGLQQLLKVSAVPSDAEEMFLVIPKQVVGGVPAPAVGILVARVLDARDIDVALQDSFVSGAGVKGSAVIDEQLTLFLDPVDLVESAGFCARQC